MKRLLTIVALGVTAATAIAQASEETGPDPVTVTYLLCAASGYCNAYFIKGTIPKHTCTRETGDAVRWDATTPAGAHMLMLLQAAHLSGKKVKISVNGCLGTTADPTHYPKLNFVQVF
jgi:hypothetical protein